MSFGDEEVNNDGKRFFLNRRIAVSPGDARRMRIAQSLDEISLSTPLPAWAKHVFGVGEGSVITACCDYIRCRYSCFRYPPESIEDDVYAIFESNGMRWDAPLLPYTNCTPIMNALHEAPWSQLYAIVKLMKKANMPFPDRLIPHLFSYGPCGIRAWGMMIDSFDPDTVSRALRYLWGSVFNTHRIGWTQVWIDLCKSTYGTAWDVHEPIVGKWTVFDCCRMEMSRGHVGSTQFHLKQIATTLDEIKCIRNERRTCIGVVLSDLYNGQHHNELFQIVSEFDVGPSSAYDTWLCPDLNVPFFHNIVVPAFLW
jgi:hypothetical protein